MIFPGQCESHQVMTITSTNGSVKSVLVVHRNQFWFAWWRHQIETFSALQALCEGNPPVAGRFPSQRPVTRGFIVFFDLPLNKRISKQSRRRWFETPSCSLWRHYYGLRTDDRPGEMQIWKRNFIHIMRATSWILIERSIFDSYRRLAFSNRCKSMPIAKVIDTCICLFNGWLCDSFLRCTETCAPNPIVWNHIHHLLG